MTVEETGVVVEGFLNGHGGPWLAEDAELHVPDWRQRHRGRLEVAAWFAGWNQVRPPSGWLLVGDGRAAVELALRGMAAPVVHAVAVLDVEGGEIVCLRLYYGPTRT